MCVAIRPSSLHGKAVRNVCGERRQSAYSLRRDAARLVSTGRPRDRPGHSVSLSRVQVRDSGPMAELDPGGAVFGPDGRFYVTMRRRRTILGISASLDGDAQLLVPEGIVPFPRGFAFGHDGSLYLASGIGPSGEGDNTIVVLEPDAPARPRPLVTDPGLSPLDMTLAPNGDILVASESPFGAPDAVVTIREYDPANGDLVRVFAPDRSLNFRQPRGLRLGPEGHLYSVGEAHVVAFDFSTGEFLGPVAQLPRLYGQALVLLA